MGSRAEAPIPVSGHGGLIAATFRRGDARPPDPLSLRKQAPCQTSALAARQRPSGAGARPAVPARSFQSAPGISAAHSDSAGEGSPATSGAAIAFLIGISIKSERSFARGPTVATRGVLQAVAAGRSGFETIKVARDTIAAWQ